MRLLSSRREVLDFSHSRQRVHGFWVLGPKGTRPTDLAYLWGGFQAKGYRAVRVNSKRYTTFLASPRLEVWLLKLSPVAINKSPHISSRAGPACPGRLRGFQAKGYKTSCAYSKGYMTFMLLPCLEVWLLSLSRVALNQRPTYFVQGYAGVSQATAVDLAYLCGGFQTKGHRTFCANS